MIPAAFDYVRATSVSEALTLLAEAGPDAKLLAGGHSLIPMMKLRFASPPKLIDIGGIAALAGIETAGGQVTVGALTTHAAIAGDLRLAQLAPALTDAAAMLGDPQVRNRGTIGGSAAHADPAADYPAVLLALEATLFVTGPRGERAIPAHEFFTGMFETALAHDELLVRIGFVSAPHSAYAKFHHPASGYAVVGAAAVLPAGGASLAGARIALTGVGERAFRASAAEAALAASAPHDTAAVEAVCARAAAGVEARADTFASAPYRSAMAGVFAARAVAAAAARA